MIRSVCGSGGLTCPGVFLSASGCPIANRNKMRSLEGGGGAGLGMGMGVSTGLAAMGEPRPPLLAASYSTGGPTGPPTAAHSLFARPLLHPLQPPPAKKLRMDDSTLTFKTGASHLLSLSNPFDLLTLGFPYNSYYHRLHSLPIPFPSPLVPVASLILSP